MVSSSLQPGKRWENGKALCLFTSFGFYNYGEKRATLLHFTSPGQKFTYQLTRRRRKTANVFDTALTKLDEIFHSRKSKLYEPHIFRILKWEEVEIFECLVRSRNQEKCSTENLKNLID